MVDSSDGRDELLRAAELAAEHLEWLIAHRAADARASGGIVLSLRSAASRARQAGAIAGARTLERERIYLAAERERFYQDAKWGHTPHTVGEWLLIVEAELGEAKRGWVKGAGDREALRELVQIMACCVACFDQHGVVERGEGG